MQQRPLPVPGRKDAFFELREFCMDLKIIAFLFPPHTIYFPPALDGGSKRHSDHCWALNFLPRHLGHVRLP